MKFYKLSKNMKADSGDIFAKGSIVQILTNGTKANPSVDVVAKKAVDEENLPYVNDFQIYTFSHFNEKEHSQVKPFETKQAEFNYPGNVLEDDDKTDGITIGLRDAYADKDYELDINGNVQKKAEMKRKAEAFNQNVGDTSTTDFDASVEGQDDPGFNDNHKEDVSEHPTPAPLQGALSSKVKDLKRKNNVRKKASPENHLLPNDSDTSIDYDMGVDGSGTVTDNYKEDTATKPTPAPMLGELAKLKRDIAKLKGKVKKAEVGDSFKIDNVTDGDSMGDNLDDYSWEGAVDEGANDEFSPKEAKRFASKKKK